MQNSFKDLKFIGVDRPRNNDKITIDNYTMVPGSDLTGIIDNNAIVAIEKVEAVTLVTSMLYDVLPNYKNFSGESYLICNSELKDSFALRLPSKSLLVGISWRSSITTSARNEHYLNIKDIESLFQIENIQFVNLQYDECDKEVEWVNERYPGKLLNFKDIDQYNDFDSVASLMCCLDLVIAPATTVAELSGALGVSTWLFSNSSELDWRKIDDEGTDVWHNSITIVDVPNKGDKVALVEKITEKLTDFVFEDKYKTLVSTN